MNDSGALSPRRERAIGHAQYQDFLATAGPEFSPFHRAREPFVLAEYRFWTVEGLYQGTKVVELADGARADLSEIPHSVLSASGPLLRLWFPAIGEISAEIRKTLLFRVLKSGKKYNPKRNRYFGAGNWAFVGHYHPVEQRIITSKDEALALLHRPWWEAHLLQYEDSLRRLARLLREGRTQITPEMIAAHGHLRTTLRMLEWARQRGADG